MAHLFITRNSRKDTIHIIDSVQNVTVLSGKKWSIKLENFILAWGSSRRNTKLCNAYVSENAEL